MQSYRKISEDLLEIDLQAFIGEYIGHDLTDVLLSKSKKREAIEPFLAEQIKLYPKGALKLPSFTQASCFFTTRSLEQASSEALAVYKAGLLKGSTLLDLSGGLGVDDWAFAKRGFEVTSVDRDAELNKVARHNFKKLSVNVKRIDARANDYLLNAPRFDVMYLDADRRAGSAARSFALADSEPDVLSMKQSLLGLCDTLVLKLSPMLDISAAIAQLKDVQDVYVVSLNNEVKELLMLMRKGASSVTAHAVDINKHGNYEFSGAWGGPVSSKYGSDGSHFYEPGLSLIKSGLAPAYLQQSKLSIPGPNTLYALGDTAVPRFFGRHFEIVSIRNFSRQGVTEYLKQNGIVQANVARRNFPADVEELKKMLNLEDGGEDYLFFARDADQKKLMFHCRKTGAVKSHSV